MTETIRAAFHRQADMCRETGSPFTADLLTALAVILDDSTQTGARILSWPGDPLRDALKLRIAGGLNALARSGQDDALTRLYAARGGDWEGVLRRVLRQCDGWLLPWLDNAPQTNEVARAGVLWPGLMTIAAQFGPKIELLELGASAGLNLNMDRFGYDLGGVVSGDAQSSVKLKPEWHGPAADQAAVIVVARSGIDLNPLNVQNTDIAERMLAYIWPDQAERVARAEAAIAIAQEFPVQVDAGDGADWIEAKLLGPQTQDVTRVIYHSVAFQYFPDDRRARVKAAIEAAGARATRDRPLAWLSMEFPGTVLEAELTLRSWPGDGAQQTLALAHPHGAWVRWHESNLSPFLGTVRER